jgi:aspartate dehydrogenase
MALIVPPHPPSPAPPPARPRVEEAAARRSARAERVAFIGLGPLARETLAILDASAEGRATLVGVLVQDASKRRDPAGAVTAPIVDDLDDLLRCSPTLVVELAGHEAVRRHVPATLRAGIDVIITSVGALADDRLADEIRAAAEAGGATARIPPGAIGGIDAIGAARFLGLDQVCHVIRKPPHSLLAETEADALVEGGRPVEVFRGSARDAIARFPASTNVTAALSLAGAGFDETEVVVLADPRTVRNQHRIEASGPFGRIVVEMENERVPGSTSGAIVAASTAASILRRTAPLGVD